MNIADEIIEEIDNIKIKMGKGAHLDEDDMIIFFLASLLEERS